MTYKTWERKLKKELKSLPKGERERALEYYREMKDDMKASGKTEESIVAGLGDAETCAKKTIADAYATDLLKKKGTASKGGVSFGWIVGIFFATILLVLPLVSVLVAIIVTLGSLCLAGVVMTVAGLIFAVGYPLMLGAWTSAAIAGVGIGIGVAGLGMIFFVVFFVATKYTAIFMAKILKGIYKRR